MVLSILHRMTGVAMSVGLIVFVLWLVAIAFDAMSYDRLKASMDSIPGQVLLLGWTYSFFFHLANGIRHLIWDTGRLFEKQQADWSAWFVIAASIVMTAGYWLAIG
jgi:succinate dehydrogenase / fumarate reductase cytochrome b subunit